MNAAVLSILLALPLVVGSMEFVLDPEEDDPFGVIRWPVMAGQQEVSESINAALDYGLITGETIGETIGFYREYRRGIVYTDFVVNYQDEDYLDISLIWEFWGAYPSGTVVSMLFSLEDGERVAPEDLFRPGRIEELVEVCDELLQENIRRKAEEDGELYDDFGEEHRFTREHLSSAGIRSEGMVFEYRFNYPHAFLAAEPSGEIFFSWDSIREYLLPGVERN